MHWFLLISLIWFSALVVGALVLEVLKRLKSVNIKDKHIVSLWKHQKFSLH